VTVYLRAEDERGLRERGEDPAVWVRTLVRDELDAPHPQRKPSGQVHATARKLHTLLAAFLNDHPGEMGLAGMIGCWGCHGAFSHILNHLSHTPLS